MQAIRNEAALGLSLRHPNIVQLYGLVPNDKGIFGIVMEWADQGIAIKSFARVLDEIILTFQHQN